MTSANFIRLLDESECPVGTGNFNSGDAQVVASYMTGLLLSAKCTKVSGGTDERNVTFKIYHSPDGVNWTQLRNSDGEFVTYQCLTSQQCATKVIDVPVLPYIKGYCGEVGTSAEGLPTCTFDLYYTSYR